MIAALTGTPGTGKTTVGRLLAGPGVEVLDLGALVERKGLHEEMDEARGSKVVDPATLSRFLGPTLREARARGGILVLEGHLAHLVRGVEVAVVLRCHPQGLAGRLRTRGWAEAKVRENCLAEALDTITVEAVEEVPAVLELDTTRMAPEDVAAQVRSLLAEPDPDAWTARRAGTVGWGEEVLAWS